MDKRIYKIGQLTIKIAANNEEWINCKGRGYKYLQRIDRARKQINKLIAQIKEENE